MSSFNIYNQDCMEAMKSMPDKAYGLAIVDPPYGLGIDGQKESKKGKKSDRKGHAQKDWDNAIPKAEYFEQLFRVSKNQIIWGGNYFNLPATRCVICWDKMQPWPNFSAWEYAWTSFDYPAKLFKYDNRTGGKIHPTQKPVALYNWILRNYAKPGQRILDTHLGSGSSAIAAHYFGCDFVGCEIDVDYFNAARERFDRETRQVAMW